MDEDIVVNVEFDDENLSISNVGNLQVVPANIAWEDFELMLKVYSDQELIKVQYTDDEKDLVTICSQEELIEAFKVAKQYNNTLNLKVLCLVPHTSIPDDELLQVTADVKKMSVSMNNIKQNDVTKSSGMQIPSISKSQLSEGTDCEGASFKDLSEGGKNEQNKKLFFIYNLGCNLVMDIQGWNHNPGTPVILWLKKDPKVENVTNQLWYEDSNTGTIRSAWNDFCLDASTNGAGATPFVFGKTSQQWSVQGQFVQHRFNPNWIVCAPAEMKAVPGIQVMAADYSGSTLQHWKIIYKNEEQTSVMEDKTSSPVKGKPRKKERARGYYSRLAETIGKCASQTGQCGRSPPVPSPRHKLARETDTYAVPPPPEMMIERDESPAWFTREIEKLRVTLTEELSERVSQQTVKHILQGLEGAVVASLQVPNTAAPKSNTLNPDTHVRYIHDGIICDHCEDVVVGVRYKCGNCGDFDLCERCEGIEGVHDGTHVLLKLRSPVFWAGRELDGSMTPLLMHNLYSRQESSSSEASNPSSPEPQSQQSTGVLSRHDERVIQKLKHKEEKLKKRTEKIKHKEKKIEEKLKKREGKMKRFLDNEERPSKKERLDLPQFKSPVRMNAEFICDESFPDGSAVAPKTAFEKEWRMCNTGTHPWSDATKLVMMWGNMPIPQAEVDIPHLQVGEEGILKVLIEAPEQPGTYQSHWRLAHDGQRFGHRIWCSVVVSSEGKEATVIADVDVSALEKEPPKMDDNMAHSEEEEDDLVTDGPEIVKVVEGQMDDAVDECTNVETSKIEDQIREAQDILSFEMLDIADRPASEILQTATPNNTPLESRDVTPPKTPTPPEDSDDDYLEPVMSSSSSVEMLGDGDQSMAEPDNFPYYVQERMALLGIRAAAADIDLASLSSGSSSPSVSDCDSDSDFYIVPIPDCFNPDLPASKSASTSIYVKKDSERSVDDMLTVSNAIETQPLLPATTDSLPQAAIELRPTNSLSKTGMVCPVVRIEPVEAVEISSNPVLQAMDEPNIESSIQAASSEDPEIPTPQQKETLIKSSDDSQMNVVNDVSDDDNNSDECCDEEWQEASEHTDTPPKETIASSDAGGNTQERRSASHIVQAALGVASQAAATALHTAKDVFHTLQANSQYTATQSAWYPPSPREVPVAPRWTPDPENWQEPGSDWEPPQSNWEPPHSNWEPPQSDWVPATSSEDVISADSSEMEQLIEMGFGDRDANRILLEKHSYNVERVIQELISTDENDWPNNRH